MTARGALLLLAGCALAACSSRAPRGTVSRGGLQLDVDSLSDTMPPVLVRLGRYDLPRQVIQCGYNGSVTVQFAIDSTGRVDHRSISILARSNPLFDEPVLRLLADSRFEPARFRGRPLRVVVRERFGFEIQGGSEAGYPGPQPGCDRA